MTQTLKLFQITCTPADSNGVVGHLPFDMLVVAERSVDATKKAVKYFQTRRPDQGITSIEIIELKIVPTPAIVVI